MVPEDPQETHSCITSSHTAHAFDVCALPRIAGAKGGGYNWEYRGSRAPRDLPETSEAASPPTESTTPATSTKPVSKCYAGGSPAEISCRAALVSLEKWIRRSCRPAAAGIGSGSPCGLWADACSEICTLMLCDRAGSAAPPRREFAISSFGSLDKPPTAHSTITVLRVNSIQFATIPTFSL